MTKIAQFWSSRAVFPNKEAGDLQQGGENYSGAEGNREACLLKKN